MMDTNGGIKSEQKGGDVCRDFLRKVCNRGKMCKYLHPENAEKKLEFCHDFQNSICSRRNCKFIHCSREDEEFYQANGRLPPSVDEVGNRGANAGASAKMEVGYCRDFMKGLCTRGGKCKFRHQSAGDMEYERMRSMRGARGGFDGFPDEGPYGFDAPRRPSAVDAYQAISRYGRPGGYDGTSYLDFEKGRQSGTGGAATRLLEEDNARLRQKLEVMRKQVEDLTSTNEVLLQQNAELRMGKSEMGQMKLSMSLQ